MAKLNWQRVRTQSLMQTAKEQDWQERQGNPYFFEKTTSIKTGKYWQIGKHKGKEVEKLPIQYLCFVSETFDEASAYKQRADSELRRRYRLLDN